MPSRSTDGCNHQSECMSAERNTFFHSYETVRRKKIVRTEEIKAEAALIYTRTRFIRYVL